MTAMEHLEAAREHLCHAMASAEEERRAAIARHFGGYHNTDEDHAKRLLEIARDVHGRLDPQIIQLGL